MPYFYRKENGKFCVYQGTTNKPEKKLKCHDTQEDAAKHVQALSINVEDAKAAGGVDQCVCPECGATTTHKAGTPCRKTECPKCGTTMEAKTKSAPLSKLSIKRQSDGTYRWASVSSVAIEDREGEVVSEKAYDDAISFATENSEYGDLDLVHIKGTSIGQCEAMFRLGKLLIELGTIPDTPRARGVIKAIEADPDYWGVSIKFTYDPEQFNPETRTYQGGVRIINRTVLPKWMAASYGTAIGVKGGTMKLDAEAVEVLRSLNLSDEDIEEIRARQQEKSVDLPNVVEKAEETEPEQEPEVKSEDTPTEEPEEEKPGILKQLRDLVARAGKPLEQAEKAETVETEVEALEPPAAEIDYDEITKRVSPVVEKGVLAAINEALEPLNPFFEAIVTRMAEQDKRAEAQDERIKALEGPVEEQITKRLAELPPVVKVSATTVEANAPAPTIVGETAPTQQVTPHAAFLAQVEASVANAVGRKLDEAKIEV